ncbi:Predicted ATPase [Lachnospiraceae bacterium]|nr:Predicted ATPase [Lachnospiraceae bacterium]
MLSNLFIKDIHIKWEDISERSYLKGIPAIASIDELTFVKPITFFVGENGSGKSTLLEAIAVAYGFNPEGGTKNYSFSTYDSHSELCDYIRISRGYVKPKRGYFLRAESFYNVATKEDEYSKSGGGDDRYIPQEFHLKSHGESFLQIAQNYFGPNGMYFLDEPEAALSPQRQLTLLYEINRCAVCGSQFIIVTHSPILLGFPDADIRSFDDGSIHRIEYEDTESYKVMEMFINRRDQVLNELLA